MEYNELLYDVSDHIATVTLNRPDKLNAWTFSLEKEYRHAMAAAEADPEVRVIILTGAGKGFCAGADMSLLTSVQDGSINMDDAAAAGELKPGDHPDAREDFKKQYSFPLAIRKPVIGAINGAAVGLGFVHALYCDVRFAAHEAKFSTTFVQRGLIGEYGIAWLLPRLVGPQVAFDLLYTGRIFKGEEAERMGLVLRSVPGEELMETARAYARELIAKSSPRSMGVIKRQVYDALHTGLGPACDVALQEMLESLGSDDFREGLMAYLEKRTPDFPAPAAPATK